MVRHIFTSQKCLKIQFFKKSFTSCFTESVESVGAWLGSACIPRGSEGKLWVLKQWETEWKKTSCLHAANRAEGVNAGLEKAAQKLVWHHQKSPDFKWDYVQTVQFRPAFCEWCLLELQIQTPRICSFSSQFGLYTWFKQRSATKHHSLVFHMEPDVLKLNLYVLCRKLGLRTALHCLCI